MRFEPPWERPYGSLLRIHTINPPTAAHRQEPEHVHPVQESRVAVHSGHLIFMLNGERHELSAGERICIPADTPHFFWKPGSEDSYAIQEFVPALNTRAFFETYTYLTDNHKIRGNGLPSLFSPRRCCGPTSWKCGRGPSRPRGGAFVP
ncbi:cupin domain-containing protein [Deinococcus peraridilitoris]|uniref:Cupin domain-containing protein n=1 Tax=Deinococcus peraridilitoris (strain DSM 19664 / LMG 22246 / CIP 109416 / KR-200) TaxID=937777 RepID=L0A1A9_DEIPD|nr:cupin domain-containing protein [Deinococcus peraridilitoris DSM 19664]